MTVSLQDRFRGSLLGLACGDAVGTAVEFRPRGSFPRVQEMTGGGPYRLKPGEWTDDTSMALCLAASLVEEEAFDPQDQMDRYVRWWKEGYFSSTGKHFDIGNTVRQALERYMDTGNPFSGPTDPLASGNGCIMRLAPVPMFCFPDEELAADLAAESARTTHGSPEAVAASRLFGWMLYQALSGKSKDEILVLPEDLETPRLREMPETIQAIARGKYREKSGEMVRGSGYVVHCLEAALWCFARTQTFRDAVLEAVNLGEDADTTGAVCGQIAGAYYGAGAIPGDWVEKLALHEEIVRLADALLAISSQA